MEINVGYILNELQKAQRTKNESEDADSTERAAKRVARWCEILLGVQSGGLQVGSRKPTQYPTWVTLDVIRGGFATGKAAADVPFSQDERERLAVLSPLAPRTRAALFSTLLSGNGLAWLKELLASRMYKIERPEDAALIVAAWLLENGRLEDAALIVDEISQYASELRFMPQSTQEPLRQTDLVHRFSSNDVRKRLSAYQSNRKIETQREALKVWIPFMDRLVAHWQELFGYDTTKRNEWPGFLESWKNAATALVNKYERLRKKHTLCTKYHNRKENLQILLSATRDLLANDISPANLGRGRHVVRCYIKAHGSHNEDRFIALREIQARVASLPGHDSIAHVLADCLPKSDDGLTNVDELLSPFESLVTPIPKRLRDIVHTALNASVPELIECGIVPSAEVMASLAPQLTASEICRSYDDENLGLLMAETYKAFSRRRSLLLFNLSSQVRFDELPWISAVKDQRRNTECHVAAALRLAGYAMDYSPGVILPNVLTEQINSLYELAGRGRPFLAELAADIFMGRFAQKFDDAALVAATLLRGSLYERYFDLDYTKFARKVADEQITLLGAIMEHMDKREERDRYNVVWNEMVIERAQIYTTHNLATLVAHGVKPERPYEELAFMAFEHSLKLIKRGREARKLYGFYLYLIKNAAYAWRQAIFFLSLSPKATVDATIRRAEELSLSLLEQRVTRELFARLKFAAWGGHSGKELRSFLGWTSGPHWLVNREPGENRVMDSIKAVHGLTPYCGEKEHLCIFINGTRLDEVLSKVEASFLGLIPSLLDWYDDDFPPSAKEKQYVWSQAKLEGGTKILPILLCPDDFDFSCTTIVVEVIDNGETVLWNRFGMDVTKFSADEVKLPMYIGKKVRWFPDVKPFVFSKSEYLKCLDSF